MGSTLTLLDVTGIQTFIFGSNRLAENVGASYLVKKALDSWLKDEVNGLGSELLFSGGGNALVRSQGVENAKSLVTGLHLKLIEEAPGLGLVCAHVAWEEGGSESFEDTYKRLHEDLAQAKRERAPDRVFNGLGVIASAPPGDSLAVEYDDKDGRWISESSKAKTAPQTYDSATAELHSLIELDQGWKWSRELGRLGRTRGDRSLLGVIHFDGNALGKRFIEASTSAEELKKLSDAVDRAGEKTLKDALEWLKGVLPALAEEIGYSEFFPVRPILYGGDDITLVCEGRIALDFAARLLECWRENTKVLPGGSSEACAGVALVPVNYPFYRAYKLSERCCKDAKTFLHKNKLANCSAVDWELSSGGTEQNRRAEEKLSCKPYLIGEHQMAHRDWNWFRQDLVGGWKSSEDKHTQLKSLAEILRQGEKETKEQLRRWKDKFRFALPEPTGAASVDGYFGGHTPYLDALEILDRVSLTLGKESVGCP